MNMSVWTFDSSTGWRLHRRSLYTDICMGCHSPRLSRWGTANSDSCHCLQSAASSSYDCPVTCFSTVGDWKFLVDATCIWSDLLQHVTLNSTLPVFKACLKTNAYSLCPNFV